MCHGCCAMCDVFVPLTLDVGFVVCDAYICVCDVGCPMCEIVCVMCV